MSKFNPCQCFSGQLYHKCCRPYHLGEAAPDAQKLMRSRYCAYAMGLSDYIMATTDPNGPLFETDAAAWRSSIERFSKGMRFIGLKIHQFVDAEPAYVTFTAHLMAGDEDRSFTEKSRFSKLQGRWFYVEPV